MSNKYDDLVTSVRDWSNRDDSALPTSIIQSSLKYAADEAYRLLMIPPLEISVYFIVTEDGIMPATTGSSTVNVTAATEKDTVGYMNYISMGIPSDATSFIFLRLVGRGAFDEAGNLMLDALGNPKIADTVYSKVYNEKTDARAFHDIFSDKVTDGFWTRQQNSLLAAGDININDVFELNYYRRLESLNARLDLPSNLDLASAQSNTNLYEVITSTEYDALNSIDQATYDLIEGSYVRSVTLKSNWLRDENERVLLYGALQHVFDYLNEPEQLAKYNSRFMAAIKELNDEDKVRTLSGGNISMNYNSGGIL